jgi:hypothetical protein
MERQRALQVVKSACCLCRRRDELIIPQIAPFWLLQLRGLDATPGHHAGLAVGSV